MQIVLLKLSFAHTCFDTISLFNILHHKTVKSTIPLYFKDQSVPILSCNYTTPIAAILFNYKNGKQDLNIDDFKCMPPDCTLQVPPFIYTLAVNVVDVDLHIINNNYLRYIFSREPTYCEPKSIKKILARKT